MKSVLVITVLTLVVRAIGAFPFGGFGFDGSRGGDSSNSGLPFVDDVPFFGAQGVPIGSVGGIDENGQPFGRTVGGIPRFSGFSSGRQAVTSGDGGSAFPVPGAMASSMPWSSGRRFTSGGTLTIPGTLVTRDTNYGSRRSSGYRVTGRRSRGRVNRGRRGRYRGGKFGRGTGVDSFTVPETLVTRAENRASKFSLGGWT